MANIYKKFYFGKCTTITMKHNKWRAYEVSVSKNELRKYLEEQKIVESLNNGF